MHNHCVVYLLIIIIIDFSQNETRDRCMLKKVAGIIISCIFILVYYPEANNN